MTAEVYQACYEGIAGGTSLKTLKQQLAERFKDDDYSPPTTEAVVSIYAKRHAKKPRVIPLDSRLLRLICWLRRRNPSAVYIFTNCMGQWWTADAWQHHFRKWAVRAGLDPRRSSCGARHGFIVRGLEQGVGEKQLADVVGHKETRTLNRWYASCTRQRPVYLRTVLDSLNRRSRRKPDRPAA